MKFDIGITNGRQFCLEIGGTRLGEYNHLEDLFKDLEVIIKPFKKNKYKNEK